MDDAELVEQHRAGAEDAFDGLYRWYLPRLTQFCMRRLRSAATAEDIAQETLLRALAHLDRFDTSRPMWPWLKAIASNLVVDEIRRRGRVVDLEPADLDRPTEDETRRRDERAVMLQALARVPQSQRAALVLRYLEDWDAHDTAEYMGLSGAAFRQVLHRGRTRLRLEYRRMSEGVGALLLPLRVLHRGVRRAADRLGSLQPVRPIIEAGSAGAAQQIAAGLLVMALATGGTVVVGSSGHRSPIHPTGARPVPVVAASHHPHERSHRATARHVPAPVAVQHRPARHAPRSGAAGRPATPASVAKDVVDPNAGVRQPEDARIDSIAISPNFGRDHTVFVAGSWACTSATCPPVLFRSIDAGASWHRLPARLFQGTQLLLPPAFGAGDDRIFAMGPAGLQVSDDGGRSFRPAATVSVPFAVGSAAISPAFDRSDPAILIGAQTLMRYRDDRSTIEPESNSVASGPLEPAYSPDYPEDPRVFVGGMQVDPTAGEPGGFVETCGGSICTPTWLPGTHQAPAIRIPAAFPRVKVLYAFTQSQIFASVDGAATFSSLSVPWDDALIWDLSVSDDGDVLLAAVHGIAAEARAADGLYMSLDRGATWRRQPGPLLGRGAIRVAATAGLIVVALADEGVACSSDGGASWATRC